MHVTAPRFEWKWSVNTIAVLVGFAAGFVAWGYTLSELETGRTTNAGNIARLDSRVTNIEATGRILDNHELRIATVESQSREAATSMRAVEQTLGALSSDIRLVREILERVERSQNGGPQQPRQ